MLIQLVIDHPEAIRVIISRTPVWVWGLLTGLVALGLSQARDRQAGLPRVALMPIAMTGFSLWGTISAFSASPDFTAVLMAWLIAAGTLLAFVGRGTSAGSYDSAARSFRLPGSWVPLALIVGLFLVKYAVGVELAMQPQLVRDGSFTLLIAGLYGAFSGIFAGRALRTLRLAMRPALSANAAHTVNA